MQLLFERIYAPLEHVRPRDRYSRGEIKHAVYLLNKRGTTTLFQCFCGWHATSVVVEHSQDVERVRHPIVGNFLRVLRACLASTVQDVRRWYGMSARVIELLL